MAEAAGAPPEPAVLAVLRRALPPLLEACEGAAAMPLRAAAVELAERLRHQLALRQVADEHGGSEMPE